MCSKKCWLLVGSSGFGLFYEQHCNCREAKRAYQSVCLTDSANLSYNLESCWSVAQSPWIASQQNSGGATSRWADRLNVFPFAPPPVARYSSSGNPGNLKGPVPIASWCPDDTHIPLIISWYPHTLPYHCTFPPAAICRTLFGLLSALALATNANSQSCFLPVLVSSRLKCVALDYVIVIMFWAKIRVNCENSLRGPVPRITPDSGLIMGLPAVKAHYADIISGISPARYHQIPSMYKGYSVWALGGWASREGVGPCTKQ